MRGNIFPFENPEVAQGPVGIKGGTRHGHGTATPTQATLPGHTQHPGRALANLPIMACSTFHAHCSRASKAQLVTTVKPSLGTLP